MDVFVTVETCQGIVDDLTVFTSAAEADRAEVDWLEALEIYDDDSRQAKADAGTEFLLFVCPLTINQEVR